ncbi:MAG: hypothetical protein H7837_10725 [Magnetococcus sp. MYC-9]
MRIPKLFRKMLQRQALSNWQGGVCWSDEGIALASVQGMHEEEGTPRIRTCLWTPWEGPAGNAPLLHTLASSHGLLKTPFNFCLDMDSYDLFPNEAADVGKEELASAMKWIVRDRLSFSVDEAVVDCFFIPDPIRLQQQRRVYVVATRKSVIQEHLNLLRPARLRLQAIEVTELALNNIMAYLPESQEGVALLYYPPGKEAGCLMVARDGHLYFTRRMRTVGTEPTLFGADPLDALADEVQRALDFVTATFTQAPVTALYLLAPTESDPVLREPLARRLNVRLKRLRMENFLDSNLAMEDADFLRCLPALGEALRPVEVID